MMFKFSLLSNKYEEEFIEIEIYSLNLISDFDKINLMIATGLYYKKKTIKGGKRTERVGMCNRESGKVLRE